MEGCQAFLAVVEDPTNLETSAQSESSDRARDRHDHPPLVAGLHKTFITPIDRDDIYRLIAKMDDVMDYRRGRGRAHRALRADEMTRRRATSRAAWSRVPSSEGRGARAPHLEQPQATLKLCIEINRLENEADAILRSALARSSATRRTRSP